MKENRIMVVGIGPGGLKGMTIQAREALEQAEVIIGYTGYVELVRPFFPDKEYRTTPMRQEAERCRLAFQTASGGKVTAVICSGDAGVYGMAGLIFQIGTEFPQTEIQVVPGVTAALAGAALLGAPLSHDFCVISLSDLLTPWEKIEKRLILASEADLVMVLYNPSSHKRKDYLSRACTCILSVKEPDTVCGLAKNIGREGELFRILTLEQLKDTPVDMFTTVFIGNSETRRLGDRMVTPRGYRNEQ